MDSIRKSQPPGRPIRILLADDHALVRMTLRDRLEAEPDIEVVADVASAEQAVAQAACLTPDIALLDIQMPSLLTFTAARKIKSQSPLTRVVFLSAFYSAGHIKEALAVEASGYITKSESTEAFLEAVRLIAGGSAYYSEEIRSQIVVDYDGAKLSSESRPLLSKLRPRDKISDAT